MLALVLTTLLLDRPLAIIGDTTVITQTELDLTIYLSGLVPNDSLRKLYLQSLIDHKILVEQALRESLSVSPEAVEQQLQTNWQTLSPLVDKLGLPTSDIKRLLRAKSRDDLLIYQLLQKHFPDELKLTDLELWSYYKEHRDSIITPPAVKCYLTFIPYRLDEGMSIAEQRLKHIITLFKNGVPFDSLLRFSDDTTALRTRGYVGNILISYLSATYGNRLLQLDRGDYSILPMPQGYLFLYVADRVAGFVSLYQLTIKAYPTPADTQATLDLLTHVKSLLREGDLHSLPSSVMLLSDGNTWLSLTDLPFTIEYDSITLHNPITISTENGFFLMYALAKRPARRLGFDEVKPQLRSLLWNNKISYLSNQLLTDIRHTVPVVYLAKWQ